MSNTSAKAETDEKLDSKYSRNRLETSIFKGFLDKVKILKKVLDKRSKVTYTSTVKNITRKRKNQMTKKAYLTESELLRERRANRKSKKYIQDLSSMQRESFIVYHPYRFLLKSLLRKSRQGLRLCLLHCGIPFLVGPNLAARILASPQFHLDGVNGHAIWQES